MPVPALEHMPHTSHKAMHWAAKQALGCVNNIADDHDHLDGDDLEWLMMCCFAAGAVWRDLHIEAPLVLYCPRDGEP